MASNNYDNNCIDLIYNSVILVLINGEAQLVPKKTAKHFINFGGMRS